MLTTCTFSVAMLDGRFTGDVLFSSSSSSSSESFISKPSIKLHGAHYSHDMLSKQTCKAKSFA